MTAHLRDGRSVDVAEVEKKYNKLWGRPIITAVVTMSGERIQADRILMVDSR